MNARAKFFTLAFAEASTNSILGFVSALFIHIFLMSAFGLENATAQQSFVTVVIFTIWSIVRGFMVRLAFAGFVEKQSRNHGR